VSDDGPEVRIPRALERYRCEQTMMCCREPFVATVSVEEETRMRTELATSESGRALLPLIEGAIAGDGDERAWTKPSGSCTQLVGRNCAVHVAGGIHALPSTCRNYPRVVHVVADHWDVSFSMSCPTAARLLSEDPRPYTKVSLSSSGFVWRPTGRRARDEAREALLAGWLAALATARADASTLMAVLGAMLEEPLAPETPPAPSERLAVGIDPFVAVFAFGRLMQLPGRAALYESERDHLVRELTAPWSVARLTAAAEAAPELLAVLVEHELHNLSLHPEAASDAVVRLAVRRGLMALRVVDALCDRVPLRTRALFADAFTLVAILGIDDRDNA